MLLVYCSSSIFFHALFCMCLSSGCFVLDTQNTKLAKIFVVATYSCNKAMEEEDAMHMEYVLEICFSFKACHCNLNMSIWNTVTHGIACMWSMAQRHGCSSSLAQYSPHVYVLGSELEMVFPPCCVVVTRLPFYLACCVTSLAWVACSTQLSLLHANICSW